MPYHPWKITFFNPDWLPEDGITLTVSNEELLETRSINELISDTEIPDTLIFWANSSGKQ